MRRDDPLRHGKRRRTELYPLHSYELPEAEIGDSSRFMFFISGRENRASYHYYLHACIHPTNTTTSESFFAPFRTLMLLSLTPCAESSGAGADYPKGVVIISHLNNPLVLLSNAPNSLHDKRLI